MAVSIQPGKGKAAKQFYIRVDNDAVVRETLMNSETLTRKQNAGKNALASFKQLARVFGVKITLTDKQLLENFKWNVVDDSKKGNLKK